MCWPILSIQSNTDYLCCLYVLYCIVLYCRGDEDEEENEDEDNEKLEKLGKVSY